MNPLDRSRIRCFAPAIVALAAFPTVLIAAPDLALEMSVTNPVPAAGQPVEFTVTLRNVGADAATGVQVTDRLPAELAIPAGTGAFVSTGSYDPASGTWTVGTLDPVAAATLVIPAVVSAATAPPCIVNVATTTHALDTNRGNDRALVAVKDHEARRCVELQLASAGFSYDPCGSSRTLRYAVRVANRGPDAATSVLVDLSQQPVALPGLRFTGASCSGLRCTLPTLAAGSAVLLEADTDSFRNRDTLTVTLATAASSAETDYATANNQMSERFGVLPLDKCDYGLPKGAGSIGCFIATAAYGSPLEAHVVALREFRDRHLRRSAAGRAFIDLYGRYSPPVAALISRHETLRTATRAALTPVVFAVERPREALVLLALALGGLGAWRVRVRGRRAPAVPGLSAGGRAEPGDGDSPGRGDQRSR
jgi:uncharacterized repeat protein (TIGR01451 family)